MDQSINQSKNQPVNQSIDHPLPLIRLIWAATARGRKGLFTAPNMAGLAAAAKAVLAAPPLLQDFPVLSAAVGVVSGLTF